SDIEGVNYFHNYYKRSGNRGITFFSFFLSQFFLALHLIFKYRKTNSLFYVNTILPFGAIIVGKILRIKVITHVHEYEIHPISLNNFLFTIVSGYSTEVVTVSEFLKNNPFLKKRKVNVIYNCVSRSFKEKAIAKKLPNPRFNLLMLASLRPYKGIMEFLSLSKMMPDFTFTLVVSESQKEVDDFTSKHPIPPNLRIYAVQMDVHPFYKKADIVLNLTRPKETVETFGMTILEGMYYGLPAIIPPVGGITELVTDGRNGYQITSDNLEKIKNVILHLADNPQEWQKLHENSLIVREKFSRTAFKERLLDLINPEGFEDNKLKENKRIVVINATTDLYGSNRILSLALKSFPKSYIIELWLPDLKGPFINYVKEENPNIIIRQVNSLPIVQRKMFSFMGTIELTQLLRGFKKNLKEEHLRVPIDLVYINTLSNFFALPVVKNLQIKSIIHVHEILESPTYVVRYLNKYTVKWADSILAVSDAVKNNLLLYTPELANKISVVHNGIPDIFISALPSKQEPDAPCLITLISRIKPEKGIWYFLDAIRLIKNKNIKVRIIGGPAPHGERYIYQLKKDISEFDFPVEYKPFMPDVSEFINETDILVVPSIMRDSFPTTVLEGMSSGKAVIATDTGGAQEAIEHLKSGIIISNDDVDSFAAHLEILIRDKTYQKQLGDAARERFLKNYTEVVYLGKMRKYFLENA
ncbi:MAG TPA: glycosyltransferase family 4 protein, partial [Anditalea sp.]|nr:glycosyltransferase family 4 protein [Anditalea sp.]